VSAIATGGSRPKIIKIVGTIDMSEGVPFANKADQDLRAQVRPTSNTTLIGAGPGAGLVNGRIDIIGVSNVIVRNLKIVAPCDIAPVFDPTDGATGSWNAAYDAIGIQGAEHVWIDHNTITDVPATDDTLPIENGIAPGSRISRATMWTPRRARFRMARLPAMTMIPNTNSGSVKLRESR
jgi:pectate lyase